jgi:DNA helicase-2/ATP-dependent DNA helicase PcrA
MIDFTSAPDSPGNGRWGLPPVPDQPEEIGPEPSGEIFSVDTPREDLPSYLSRLNDRQLEAALEIDGPVMVLAGAGSGKTGMVTSRIAYLIDQLGVPPHRILAVTFTNKAAGEMRERVERLLETDGPAGSPGHRKGQPEIGTFHSICVRILRREGESLPFTKPFVIYDDSDQLALVKQIMKRMDLDTKTFSPKRIQGAINRAKCDALGPDEMEVSKFSQFEKKAQEVYRVYQRDLIQNNALDFGEILCLTYRLLRDRPEVRKKYQRWFQYIHVDEYQDTNRAQYLLLSTLASPDHGGHGNICVVGDEDQSIYKWRGADIRNILEFESDYSNGKIIKLEQNYRSTPTIIQAASEVISHNTQRKNKNLWTDNPDGEPITRIQVADEKAEAEFVIKEIKKRMEDGVPSLRDFAIFYRTHAQSRNFEDVLRRENMPYQIVGGLRFYDRKEIKDILAYLRVIFNPSDSVSLARIINVPTRGIGKGTIEKLNEMIAGEQEGAEGEAGEGRDLWSALVRAAEDPDILKPAARRKVGTFVAFMMRLMTDQPSLLLSELYHRVLDDTGYVQSLKKEGTPEADARIENLEEFDNLVGDFEENLLQGIPEERYPEFKPLLLGRFIEESSLVNDAIGEEDPTALRLMTLHGSKGLEFPVVFMVGMEEGLFPSVRPWEETPPEEMEEERRLCYVGMTRARQKLFMSNAVLRRIWGSVSYQEPARFFAEMPMGLVEEKDMSYGGQARERRTPSLRVVKGGRASSGQNVPQRSDGDFTYEPDYDQSPNQQVLGRAIDHPQYGRGNIILAEGSGEQLKVTIEFRYKVRRKFFFRYVQKHLVDNDTF